jgi:hypothetical protein
MKIMSGIMEEHKVDIYPVTEGPQFDGWPEVTKKFLPKSPCMLRDLAAKTAGQSCKAGVYASVAWLIKKPYPVPLVHLIHPWLNLSLAEWLFFEHQETRWPLPLSTLPRYKRICRHYKRMYPKIVYPIYCWP